MRSSLKTLSTVSLVALLAVALAVPGLAGAAGGPVGATAISDDDIPGARPLPASPFTDSLDYFDDATLGTDGDVFSVDLEAGETFTARLSGVGAGDEFVMSVYAPEATTVNTDTAPIVGESFDVFYPAFISDSLTGTFGYTAPASGTYYFEVYTYGGTGPYTVDWVVGARPTVTSTRSHTITYGQSSAITGSVLATDGTGVAGQTVELYAWKYGTEDYSLVKSAETTTGGAYHFDVKPKLWTYYKVVALVDALGHSFAQSAERQVKVRAVLTRPKTSTTIYRNRYFKVWGYLSPRHKAGSKSVYVYAYHKRKQADGTWGYTYVKKIATRNYDTNTRTKYYAKYAKLPYRGTWKLVAKSADDGQHAYSYSAATYVKVR